MLKNIFLYIKIIIICLFKRNLLDCLHEKTIGIT